MVEFSRRRAVVAGGALVSSALAGCLSDTTSDEDPSEDEPDPLADAVTSDGEVKYPAFVGDEIDVDEEAGLIEYGDPDAEYLFHLQFEGADPSPDELWIGRDLSMDAMRAFIGPEFDADDELTHHVFANEAFVEYADWNAIYLEGESLVDEEEIAFEELDHGVYHRSVSPPEDATGMLIADDDADGIEAEGSEPTLVGIIREVAPDEDPVPAVSFSTDIDERPNGTKTITITHHSGDEFASEHVVAEVGDEIVEDPFGEATVSEDDSATFEEVPEGAAVRLVYDDGDNEAVLASFDVDD